MEERLLSSQNVTLSSVMTVPVVSLWVVVTHSNNIMTNIIVNILTSHFPMCHAVGVSLSGKLTIIEVYSRTVLS